MANRKGLAKRDPRDIQLAGFTLTAVGVEVAGKPTLDEWRAAMQFIDRASSASMWWHGDMLNFGYASYGELASQEDGDGRYSQKSLYSAKYVAESVPFAIRMANLSFGHHQVVAGLPVDEQVEWLAKAADDNLSVSALRRETADARAALEIEERPLPTGKYRLILADPPWRYDFSVSDSRKIENQYPTMEVGAICGLPIRNLADTNCVLFLWGTSPKLIEAFDVIEAWGFDYKTCMVWRKDKIGMGYYARQQHELLLIATCGSPKPPPEDSRPPSVIDGERAEHSKKPEVFYELIERMYPRAKRVELFCRNPRKGWDAWGNEVTDEHTV
jgi:N6-adenosine-specific RNA methylase IME4